MVLFFIKILRQLMGLFGLWCLSLCQNRRGVCLLPGTDYSGLIAGDVVVAEEWADCGRCCH